MLAKNPAHACKQGGKLCLAMRPGFCEHGLQLRLCGGHGDTMRLGNRREAFSVRNGTSYARFGWREPKAGTQKLVGSSLPVLLPHPDLLVTR